MCPADGSVHHPRHDPAVIMTVTGPDDRLLLGHQGRWPEGRFSAFAGFVEPGESLEAAVARELLEEAGVRAQDPEYLGSQPWPFPASLMLAFHAETPDTHGHTGRGRDHRGAVVRAAGAARRRRFRARSACRPRVSVARRLIERWLGAPLEQDRPWAEPTATAVRAGSGRGGT